jgi:hypothetical protein
MLRIVKSSAIAARLLATQAVRRAQVVAHLVLERETRPATSGVTRIWSTCERRALQLLLARRPRQEQTSSWSLPNVLAPFCRARRRRGTAALDRARACRRGSRREQVVRDGLPDEATLRRGPSRPRR